MGLKVKQVDGLQAAIDAKLTKNAAIIAATKTKITYDANGLVTAGTDITAADLPSGIDAAKINTGAVTNTEFNYLDGVTSAIQTQIDSKVAKNANITAGTYTKVTVDVKGLVTAGAALVEADIPTLSESKITNLVSDLAGKALKIVGGTSGNIVTHNAAGVIQDSGKKFDDAGTSANDIWSASKVQTAINAGFGANDAMVYKGVLACAANPNYPAGVQGDTYKVSTAGKIGGASGLNVESGDMIICITDSASGPHGTVGVNWNVIQTNIDGAVISSDTAAVISGKLAIMDGTSGKVIKAGTKTINELQSKLTGRDNTTTNQTSAADTEITLVGFFSAAPPASSIPVIDINGVVVLPGTTGTSLGASTTPIYSISSTALKLRLPYALEASDVIHAVFATE